jgi:diguanylate cyclase (GGDEF)-like protein/PAS domain S-box-containing protein
VRLADGWLRAPTRTLNVTEPQVIAARGLPSRFHAAYLHDHNRAATAYWCVMVLLGVGLLGWALQAVLRLPMPQALQIAAGVACATLAGLAPIRVPRTQNAFAAGEIFIFLLLLLHGTPAALLAASVEAGVATLRTSRRLSSRLASPALAAVAMSVAGATYEQIVAALSRVGLDMAWVTLATLLGVAIALAALRLVLQTSLFALKARRVPMILESLAGFGWTGIVNSAAAAVSGLLFFSFQQLGSAVLLIAVPIIAGLLAALHLYSRLVDMDEQNRRARVEAAQREAAQAARHLEELQRSEQRFHSAFSHAAIGMALVGPDGGVLQANRALSDLLGTPDAAVLGQVVTQRVSGADAVELQQAMDAVRQGRQRSFSLQVRCLREDGESLYVTVDGSMFADGSAGQPCLILQLQDVSARVRVEHQLQHIAYHDALTDLANRGHFLLELDKRLAQPRRYGDKACAVLFLDFDRFKLINDSLGHNIGDGFLKEVAGRLAASVPPGDMVARLGGDEFAVLLREVDGPDEVEALAMRLQAVIREPMLVDGQDLHTSASIGIRLSDASTRTPQDLLRDADTAMYRAKAAGKARHCLFDAGMHAEVKAQLEMERELRLALKEDKLDIELQPIVDAHTGEVVAWESLARWRHPRLGPLPAERFIRLAEECGLIRQLSQRILERSCQAIHTLRLAKGQPQNLHVNISTLDLCHNGYATRMAELLLRTGLQPGQLWLEITERSVAGHLDAIVQSLHDLRDLGVGLCLDDFGTGHSSMRHLSDLPIQRLKVDGSLLRDSRRVPAQGLHILRAVAQLGHSLGLAIVAEGVETAEQLALVRELGCRYAQGYLFGRPMSALSWAHPDRAVMTGEPAAMPVGASPLHEPTPG